MDGVPVKYTRDGATKTVKVGMATIFAIDALRMVGAQEIAIHTAIVSDPEFKKIFADAPAVANKLALELAKPVEQPATPIETTKKAIETFLSKSDTWPRPR
jgi:hypothetical protein